MRLLSPVYFKELGQLAHSRKPLVMKAVLAFILLIDFVIVMFSTSTDTVMGSSEIGLTLFVSMSFIGLIAMTIFTPIVTAGMVCGEKEANTLGLLFLTRLKAWNIVQDKGLSRVTFMVFICVMTLPFMFATLLFGGVDTGQIITVAGNILAVILLCGGISMLCSTLTKKFGAALAMAYSSIFVYMIILPIAIGIIGSECNLLGNDGLNLVACINPFFSSGMAMSPYSISRIPLLKYTWCSNLLVGLLVYLVAVVIASGILRRFAFEDRMSQPSKRKKVSFRRLTRFAFVPLLARLFQRGKTVSANPILWKESNLTHDNFKIVLMHITNVLLGIYFGMFFIGYLMDGSTLEDEDIHIIGHAFAFFIYAVFTAILAASSFSRERESGTLDIVLTTRLTSRAFVVGTFLGLVRSVLPFMATMALILLFGFVFAWDDFRILVPLLNVVVYTLFIIAMGMRMSLCCKSTAKAIGWTLAILLFLTAGIPIIALISSETFSGSNFVIEFIMSWSPDYWIAQGPETHNPYNDLGVFPGYIVVTATYIAATIALLIFTTRSFDKRVGRQPHD